MLLLWLPRVPRGAASHRPAMPPPVARMAAASPCCRFLTLAGWTTMPDS